MDEGRWTRDDGRGTINSVGSEGSANSAVKNTLIAADVLLRIAVRPDEEASGC